MYHDSSRSDPCPGSPVRPGSDTSAATDAGGRVLGRKEALTRFDDIDSALWERVDADFPVRVTRSWADRVEAADDPLGLQVFPGAAELDPDPGDVPDPVGEQGRSPVPFVVRKHADRVLLLVTRRCHLNCRFCFRRDQSGPEPSAEALDRALAYVRSSGARELILSGGDPLVLTDERLFAVIDGARPEVPVVRIHSRAPISEPSRVTDAFVRGLRERAPIWVVVHTNHARELSDPVRRALARFVDAGLPVLAQTVLLRRVNDDADVLVELFETLQALRVQPYTLHHTDRVPGNAVFRVSIDEGLALYHVVGRRLGGVALPRYVIDPPDGSSKVPVADFARLAGPPVPGTP